MVKIKISCCCSGAKNYYDNLILGDGRFSGNRRSRGRFFVTEIITAAPNKLCSQNYLLKNNTLMINF